MLGAPTADQLLEMRQAAIEARRAQLRERFAYLTAEIEKAEQHGAEKHAVKSLKTLLAFVVRDADTLDKEAVIRAKTSEAAELRPLAAKGEKFNRPGRGEGPVKVLIRKVLPAEKRRLGRKPTTLELWQACKAKAPRTMQFYGTGPRPTAIWHIKTKGEPDTSYTRFGVSISEVRKALATPPAGG
jgi:hypothetical protein